MVCYTPLTGFHSKLLSRNGKRPLTFNRSEALFVDRPIRVPCGQCVGCRIEYGRQWAMRCTHESKMHSENCFITLTYRDECIPDGGTLVKRDLWLFMKALHNRLLRARGHGIRYYAAGEYGETYERPHYHACVFGWSPSDKRRYGVNHRDEALYSSAFVEDIWKKGFNVIGDVTFDSASYVAGYCVKKQTGKNAEEHYVRLSPDGLYHQLQPEFACMSKGIGRSYYMKYGHEVYDHDSVIFNGIAVQPPRYYDTQYEYVDSMFMDELRSRRRLKAAKHRLNNTTDRLRVREVVQLWKLAFRRSFK